MKIKKILSVLLMLFIILLSSCVTGEEIKNISDSVNHSNGSVNENLIVSIIDVGQGDSILIKTPKGKYVLIDSGSQNEKEKFFKFISRQNINSFEVVVATHPHEDHIGNLDEVITNYNVENIYMPKVTSNTSTFRNLMTAIKNKGLKVKNAFAGVSFDIDGVKFAFLAPNSQKYDELNNYSAVLKVTYKDKSFLLMGDAEKLSENEILKNAMGLNADVIKVGHHGSSSSSSKAFINAVSPKYAVISCGKNNDYGHPHRETLKLLSDMKIKTFRTDIDGTIIFTTNGNDIKTSTIN